MRLFFLVVFLIVLIPGFSAPAMGGERGKIDGCLTSLYNYPAEVSADYRSRPEAAPRPLVRGKAPAKRIAKAQEKVAAFAK